MHRITLGLVFVLAHGVVLNASAPAQPHVDEVVGDPTPGQTVTIYGGDFGEAPQILTWDRFETGNAGDQILDSEPEQGFPWQVSASAIDQVTYSADRSFSGVHSARLSWPAQPTAGVYVGWFEQGPYPQLYLSFMRYQPSRDAPIEALASFSVSMTSEGPFTYALRATYHGQQDNFSGRILRDAMQPIIRAFAPALPAMDQVDRWQHWEIEYRVLNDTYCDLTMVVDAVPRVRVVESELGPPMGPDWYGVSGLVLGGTLRQDIDVPLDVFYDDVYAATSPARVEIGNAQVYESCTRRQILVFTRWSTNQIEVEYRNDGLPTDAEYYLFVIDSQGQRSEPGYAVSAADWGVPDTPGQVELRGVE